MHLICGPSPTQHRSANQKYGAGYTRNLRGEERFIPVLPDESAVTPEDGATRQVQAEGIGQVLDDVLAARA
jgi:hypothetical protein